MKGKVTHQEKDHTQMQQEMDPQVIKKQNRKYTKQITTADRIQPQNKAGESTHQNGMKLIGQVAHGTRVDSPPISSNHRPQTAATSHGARHRHHVL